MKWTPLLLFVAACAAFGQEEAVETRRFAVGFLVSRPMDRIAPSLGLAQDAIGAQVTQGEEIGGGLVGTEGLIRILQRDVVPESWKVEGMSLEADDLGVLVAVNRRAVLDGVAAWLARARARYARRLAVDAAWVVVPFDAWGRVEPRGLQAASKVLQSARLFAAPGSRVHAQNLVQQAYVRDYDVQISTGAAGLDPIVDVLSTGGRIDLCAWPGPAGERIVFDVRAEFAAFEGMDERTLKLQLAEAPAGPGWEGLVQLPRTTFDRIRGRAVAKPGETVVAASASRADGVLALLLTPTFVDDGVPAAADPPGAFTRLYDVGAITARVQDWAGPRPELVSPTAGGAGPLTGATFTLDEPREGYGLEQLADEVEKLVGKKNLEKTEGAALAVRATAEQQARVEALLSEHFVRESRTVQTEAAIVAFKAGARAEWAKTVTALAPGGSRSPDEAVAALLEEARKGAAVRLAGWMSAGGKPGQRIHLLAGKQRAYVQDFEPQMSTSAGCYDPIIGLLLTGLGMDLRPVPRADGGAVDLQLKLWMLAAGEPAEEKKVSSGGGPIQRPTLSGPIWDMEVACLPGQWTLAALESRGDEEVALFVRVR